MEDGVNSAIGKIAQSPVEVLSTVGTVNVTTLLQHMVGRIALLMAQLTSKQRDVMKIHVQVCRLITITLIIGSIPSNCFYDDIFSKYNPFFCKFLPLSKRRMGKFWRLGGMSRVLRRCQTQSVP